LDAARYRKFSNRVRSESIEAVRVKRVVLRLGRLLARWRRPGGDDWERGRSVPRVAKLGEAAGADGFVVGACDEGWADGEFRVLVKGFEDAFGDCLGGADDELAVVAS